MRITEMIQFFKMTWLYFESFRIQVLNAMIFLSDKSNNRKFSSISRVRN